MTVGELAGVLCARWDSHLPTVTRIVGEYALVFGFVDTRGEFPDLPAVELTQMQADRIREVFDVAEYAAGRTPLPG